MTIDRRHLLGSLAAAAVCPSVASTALAAAPTLQARVNHQARQSSKRWFLAREDRNHQSDHTVDFWVRPFSDVAYTKHLPSEIIRGAMLYDAYDSNCETVETILQSFDQYPLDWAENPKRYASCPNAVDNLSSVLQFLTKNDSSNSTKRTALLSLDSISPSPMREPSWAEVLPAFRSCYDHIVGHFHLPQRGLRQYREFLNANFGSQNERGYFQEFFTDAAMQCDAVILTSCALVESGLRCCPRSSSEELVGELMRDLGCALLTPAVLERIVGKGAPRFFALSSLVSQTLDDYYLYCDLILSRQADLVRGSFGDAIPDEQLLLVATAAEDIHSDFFDEVWKASDGSFFIATEPAHGFEKRGYPIVNQLKMITLWPFEFEDTKSN